MDFTYCRLEFHSDNNRDQQDENLSENKTVECCVMVGNAGNQLSKPLLVIAIEQKELNIYRVNRVLFPVLPTKKTLAVASRA